MLKSSSRCILLAGWTIDFAGPRAWGKEVIVRVICAWWRVRSVVGRMLRKWRVSYLADSREPFYTKFLKQNIQISEQSRNRSRESLDDGSAFKVRKFRSSGKVNTPFNFADKWQLRVVCVQGQTYWVWKIHVKLSSAQEPVVHRSDLVRSAFTRHGMSPGTAYRQNRTRHLNDMSYNTTPEAKWGNFRTVQKLDAVRSRKQKSLQWSWMLRSKYCRPIVQRLHLFTPAMILPWNDG
jgi:hypothetical protein